MKVQRIDFDHELPSRVTVEMTIHELALVSKLTGRESGRTLTEAGLGNLIEVNGALYDGAIGVFNSYFDTGVDGFLRGDTY
jgi:hypothetical protein